MEEPKEEGFQIPKKTPPPRPGGLDAVWCTDSERGEEVLISRLSNRVIARRINGVIWPVGREGLNETD